MLVLDLGPEGAGIEHTGALGVGEVHRLQILARKPIELIAKVRHSILRKLAHNGDPAVYHTGVSFIEIDEVAGALIENVLIDEVRRKVVEWEANLTGTRRGHLPRLTARPELPGAFLWLRYVGRKWIQTVSRDPNQPADGFAVCDDQDPAQVELLCRAYERYDDDDRYMLRLMAHLAIAERGRG